MRIGNRRLRHHFLQIEGDAVDVIDPVRDIINLSAARELAHDGLADHDFIVFHYIRLDRLPVLGRLLEDAHVTDSGKTHVQRARNGCRRQGEHIDVFAHLLDLFLLGHTKTLFLIDDEEPEVFKLHVL